MKVLELNAEIGEYVDAFTSFNEAYQLPRAWFNKADHFALKCSGPEDYQETLETIQSDIPVVDTIWEIDMDERRLASVRLTGCVCLSNSMFRWIEVMEPRSGKEPEEGFLEHTEFFVPDLYKVYDALERRGVEGLALQGNGSHTWVNVPIDEKGHEIKFNDKPIEQVILEENEQGLLRKLVGPDELEEGAKILPFRKRAD